MSGVIIINVCTQCSEQAYGDKTRSIITPTSYQAHFTVKNGASLQVVGVTLQGLANTNGGGINVEVAGLQLGTQDAAFINIISGPAIKAQSAEKVHIR